MEGEENETQIQLSRFKSIHTAVTTICSTLNKILLFTFLLNVTKRRTTICKVPVKTENVKIKIQTVSCKSENTNTIMYTV